MGRAAGRLRRPHLRAVGQLVRENERRLVVVIRLARTVAALASRLLVPTILRGHPAGGAARAGGGLVRVVVVAVQLLLLAAHAAQPGRQHAGQRAAAHAAVEATATRFSLQQGRSLAFASPHARPTQRQTLADQLESPGPRAAASRRRGQARRSRPERGPRRLQLAGWRGAWWRAWRLG